MIGVEHWAEIRRLYLAQGWKKRAIARHLGLQRRTVDPALASELSPRYQRASRPSCLDDHKPRIRSLLQRFPKLSAVRILEELQGAGHQGQLTVRRARLHPARTGRGESVLSGRLASLRARQSDPHLQSPFGSWGMIFGDTTAAVAIIDRLIHHAGIIALEGSSFRTRGKEQAIPSTVPPPQETH